MSRPLHYALLGGVASLVAVGVLAVGAGLSAPGVSEPARLVVQTDPTKPLPPRPAVTCSVDRRDLKMDARPEPGLSQTTEVPVIPTYRSYMAARLQVLVCPARDSCALPEALPASLWLATDHRTYRRAALEAEVLSRGRCVELRWQDQADQLWPDAEQGVVQWAAIVGEPVEPVDLRQWRADGGLVWQGDVVYAGQDGSPEVY